MKDFFISIMDKILAQNIYFVGALGLGTLLTFLIIAIVILVLTFKKSKLFGKIVRSIFLTIMIPETIYVIYWFVVFIQLQTGGITQIPV